MSARIAKTGIFFLFGGILLILGTLTSCVDNTELKYFGDQIGLLNNRVSELEQSKLDRSEFDNNIAPSLQSIHDKQAELGVEIDKLKRSEEILGGRVDDNEMILKRTVERDLGTRETASTKIDELIRRVDHLETLVKAQQQYLNLEEPAVPAEKPGEETGPAAEGKATTKETAPPAPAVKPSGEVELYDFSLAAFHNGQYEKAMDGFRDFLKAYPKSDRADNAQFWIGECYMALKQYEQAILAYQKVIKDYPKGNKVANAMLRQAIAFLEIKDKTSATLLLKRIIKQYPNSSEADIAAKKLEAIK